MHSVIAFNHHQKQWPSGIASIKLINLYTQKCHDTNSDIHLALLQIRMMSLGPGLPSSATLLFNQIRRGIMPIINRIQISIDNDDLHHKASVAKTN